PSESAQDHSAGQWLCEHLRSALPFAPTGAQARAVAEIESDLAGPHPMRRLLQGDVGSGKTAVAALASAQAIGVGRQVVFMAPTELLAEQHRRSLAPLCEAAGIELELLTASTPAADRKRLRTWLKAGEPMLMVGTHA